MRLFEIAHEISAKDAAIAAGLQFDGKKAFCVWHDDGKHPALHFFPDGKCFCFVCQHGGDAIDLYAQIYGLRPAKAAAKLANDFGIQIDTGPLTPAEVQQIADRQDVRRQAWQAKQHYDHLYAERCAEMHQASKAVSQIANTRGINAAESDDFWTKLNRSAQAEVSIMNLLERGTENVRHR